MISAGLPLVNSLSILIEQTNSSALKKALQSVYKNVQEGGSLSTALALHPSVFPKVMVYLVESGELGGVLDQVMEQLALQLEKDHRLSQRVKSAMYYPASVLGIALIGVFAMITFIMPGFAKLYIQMHAQLPLPTRMLIAASDVMRNYGV